MQTEQIDHTQPGAKWEFDESVTTVFDNMLARSIPQYEVMRQSVFSLACNFQKENAEIVDLGCSRGEALAPLVDQFGAHNHFTGIEISDPMIEAATKRFQGYINCGVVNIRKMDLRIDYPRSISCVTLCVLTLQFTPIEYRQRIVRDIYKNTISGGVLILVEKVLGANADIDALLVKNYYGLKSRNGYSQEDIERKRLSLEGVLVPVTAKWNEELLSMAGFRQVDCFWRWMNFAGWVAVKE